MSLKKIVSICVTVIISISLFIVLSFAVMSDRLEALEKMRRVERSMWDGIPEILTK